MLLDKQQRNLLFRAIQVSGFDPHDFDVHHTDIRWKLTHRARGDWFALTKEGKGLIGLYKVGKDRSRTPVLANLERVEPYLKSWLDKSETDHEVPDLWADLDKEQQISDLMEGQENTPFSAREQQQIAEVVADVLAQARETYGLPDEELRLLEAKLDYLIDAARHTRRIDWLNTAVGAVAGAFAGGVLTPEVVQKVLGALNAGLGPLFGHPLPVLGP